MGTWRIFLGIYIYCSTNNEPKKGYNISGLPGMAFLFFLVASYLSLNRWLMLISLSDVSIITLVITICTDFIHKKKRNEQDRHE